ncbi:MAG: TolC family protein [Candidatus Omnitrophota bacterium]
MKKIALFFIIFFFLNSAEARAESISLTLQEAVSIALRDNRDILLQAEEVKRAKEGISQAKAALMPTLNFTGTWSDTRNFYAKDLAQTTTQATLKQYLYTGGRTINTIQQNKYKLQVSESLLDKEKLELVLDVSKAFYNLILASDFAKVNKGILQNTLAHLEFIMERYASGETAESDLINIKSSLASVEQVYAESLNQIKSNQELLNTLLYLDKAIEVTPLGEFRYEEREVAFDEAFLRAMKQRPEIRQFEAQSKADKKAVEIAKADTRPSIYASWDYYSRSTSQLTFTPSKAWNDWNVVGLTFSWPVFDGFATKTKVQQAIIDLKATELTKEKTIRDIAQELKTAYLDLSTAIGKIKSTRSETDLYKDTLRKVQEKYNAGEASSLELDDASLGYAVSLFNHKEAVYDYVLAKARFDKATGGL